MFLCSSWALPPVCSISLVPSPAQQLAPPCERHCPSLVRDRLLHASVLGLLSALCCLQQESSSLGKNKSIVAINSLMLNFLYFFPQVFSFLFFCQDSFHTALVSLLDCIILTALARPRTTAHYTKSVVHFRRCLVTSFPVFFLKR